MAGSRGTGRTQTVRVFNGLGNLARPHVEVMVPEAELIDVTPDGPAEGVTADVMFGGWGDPEVLARHLAAGVRWVQLAGTGIDGVHPAVLDGDWIVTNVPGAAAVPIAEFVFGAMLAFEKRFPQTWLSGPPEHWNFAGLGGLAGKTVGIVGFGGIGRAVARRALAFEMRVLATRRRDRPAGIAGVELVQSASDLFGIADHLVLAVPATPRTRGLLDADAFAAMKPGIHLVNIARGALVDEEALRDALDDERVAMATLDTVAQEPLPEGHWMYEHPRVRVSAHVSWASSDGFRRPVEMFVENLRRFIAGDPLQWVVDLDEGY